MGYTGSMCTVITPSGNVQNLDFVMMSFDVDFTFQTYGVAVTAGMYIAQVVDELDLPESVIVAPKYASNFLPTVSAVDHGKGLGVYGGKWGLTAGSPITGLASYKNIQRMLGIDLLAFPLWSQIRAFHDDYGEIVFDVVNIDRTSNELTLLMHDCLTGLEMDASEALVICPNGLPAGTYYFDATQVSRYSSWQKVWSWTLTQAVPAGGVLRPEIDVINWAPQNMRSYTSQLATEPIETVALSQEQDGTDITSVISAANTNNFDRAVGGSGNYEESAMHKYLTSSAGPGAWWTPSSIFDMAPSYVGKAGFMAGFSDEFLDILDTTTQTCATGHYYENTGYTVDSSYTVSAKFFLPSLTQLCGEENGYDSNAKVAEGTQWGAFVSAQYSQDNEELVKYSMTDHANPIWWWQRSCDPWDPGRFRNVRQDGNPSSGGGGACNPFRGLAVACVISAI